MNIASTRRVDALVMRWNQRLVRGLPAPAAEDRTAQITSDLWEQRSADPRPEARVTRSILLRALRGVPADLLWRRATRVGAAQKASTTTWTDRSRGTIMKKKTNEPAKPWVQLTGIEKPFDQTNGAVDFDTPDKRHATDVEGDILAKGVATNTVAVGFFGGGGA